MPAASKSGGEAVQCILTVPFLIGLHGTEIKALIVTFLGASQH